MSAGQESKLLFPGLANFYASWGDITFTLMRIVVGVMFLMHVSIKYKIGAAAVAANIMAKNGLQPALGFAYVTMALETVGGVCLIIGLFTRFFAAATAVLIGVAFLFVHLPRGYSSSVNGYEYILLIGVALLAIAMRGGGPYSVDRYLGKEL